MNAKCRVRGLLDREPVGPDARVHLERRVEIEGGAHLTDRDLLGALHLPRGPFEEELIVDLEDEPRFESFARKRAMATHHGELDDVRGGSLNDGVDRKPLSKPAALALIGAK